MNRDDYILVSEALREAIDDIPEPIPAPAFAAYEHVIRRVMTALEEQNPHFDRGLFFHTATGNKLDYPPTC